MRDLTARPLPRRIPFWAARAAGLVEEAKAALFGIPPRITRAVAETLQYDWTYDSDAAIGELGYRMTPLEEGVRRLIQSLKSG